MSGLIGRKIGMSSLFDEKGKNIPCTVLELGPCVITQIKTKDIDGYEAFQLGFEDKPIRKVNKSMSGHFNKAKVDPKKKLIEFKMNFERDLKLGDTITVEHFKEGEYELVFFVGDYFKNIPNLPKIPFLNEVTIRFGVSNPKEHYHVPLLVSPWSYSTYRGS